MIKKIIYLSLPAILLLFAAPCFAQAPDLKNASAFALFTSSGAFGNSGATSVTGYIGTNVGALTGFPPGTVNGLIHVADSVSALAAIDVDSAYLFLGGLTCDTTIGTTLGNNQTLTPGIYCLGGISTLNGNLTLNGQGNSGALFIFKINGAFTSAPASNVILADSASLCNVYWQINGATTLGDSSVFRGTIIGNGAISLLDSAYLLGRGLTRQGAIALSRNVATICMQAFIPMPVTLVSFTAEKNGENPVVNLNWQTASEVNSAYFLVERSGDGIRYEPIGHRNAAGQSSQLISYSLTDEHPYPGINYYRLNQFDFNGTHTYSPARAVHISSTDLAIIYPNPFTTSIKIALTEASQAGQFELKIYDIMGAVLINVIIHKTLTTIETTHLPAGVYFYKMSNMSGTIKTGRLISTR